MSIHSNKLKAFKLFRDLERIKRRLKNLFPSTQLWLKRVTRSSIIQDSSPYDERGRS